jgi:outer membrane protein assembly factor BamE
MPEPSHLSRLLLAGALVAALAACSGNPLAPYRMEIQQGNYITQEAVSQLKPGMTKEQVRFVLGTPLINDIFHENRWDYVFMLTRNRSSPLEERRLTVFFDPKGVLDRLEGDVVPPTEAAEFKK